MMIKQILKTMKNQKSSDPLKICSFFENLAANSFTFTVLRSANKFMNKEQILVFFPYLFVDRLIIFVFDLETGRVARFVSSIIRTKIWSLFVLSSDQICVYCYLNKIWSLYLGVIRLFSMTEVDPCITARVGNLKHC